MTAMRYLPFLLAALLVGCGLFRDDPPPPSVAEARPEPPKTTLHLDIAVLPSVNPNSSGKPTPVEVLVYQLAYEQPFLTADFFKLYQQQEIQALGNSLLDTRRLMLAPGESLKLDWELRAGVHHIGVAAVFRSYQQAEWRKSAPVAEGVANRLAIRIEGLKVSVEAAP